MGRQGMWAIGVGVLMLALTGGIIAFEAGSGEPAPTAQEQAEARAEQSVAAVKRAKVEGIRLWEQRLAAGGYSRTSALPDEELCGKQWTSLGLDSVYGDNRRLFVRECVQGAADKMMGG
ncbi:hypothetical protein [Streptomyces sp. NPDC057557]|uniref:hypothetical protein n=1 Tax=Streptomyces sp. NPDC057557 TaxID=3346167 RepID=UPI00367656F9